MLPRTNADEEACCPAPSCTTCPIPRICSSVLVHELRT
jgi:hypothetical protein